MKSPLRHGLVLMALMLSAAAASAVPVVYTTTLSGLLEAPPNASPGTGTALLSFDPDAHTLYIETTFSGLLSPTTVAHIHCCTATPNSGTAGVATQTPTFIGFPAGVQAGSYSQGFDTSLASTWNASFITNNGGTVAGAEAAFGAGLAGGQAYLNIHSEQFPAGEIRGFLAPIPEPGAWAMLLAGLPLVMMLARRRKAKTGAE